MPPSTRRTLLALTGLLVLAAGAAAWVALGTARRTGGTGAAGGSTRPASEGPRPSPDVEPVRPSPDFVRLGAPRPGEWRAAFEEPAQTLAAWRAGQPRTRRAGLDALVLVPLTDGDRAPDPALLRDLETYTGAFFALPVRLAAPQELVPAARRAPSPSGPPGAGRFDAGVVLEDLRGICPPDALLCLGVTAADLTVPSLSFVFGLGDYKKGVGVVSGARLGDPSDPAARPLTRRRLLKLAVHEAGHQLSISHCAFYRCVMQGSNHLAELDAAPPWLCPVDEAKVREAVGAPRRARTEALLAATRALGLEDEAGFHARRMEEEG